MDKKNILELFKNNVINWYDFKDNSNIIHVYDENEIIGDFDYIIIHNKLELIDNTLKHLKKDGSIILLLNNKFGISNFVTENGIEKNSISYSKLEIEQKLNNLGLKYKFFYPLPNNEITNCVFSDDYLPQSDSTKINNNNIYDEDIYINEIETLKNVIKAGKFTEFTNSYFVEINPQTQIKFASYNNLRKEEYRVCTRIYSNFVEKVPINQISVNHINKIRENIDILNNFGLKIIDKYENGKIVSPYINEKLLYKIIIEKILKNEIDETINLIKKWYNCILEKMSNCSKKFIDLTFENTFYINEGFVFFDQEWVEENIPDEFILYRSIYNLYTYNGEISKFIELDEMLNRLDLLDKKSQFIKIEQEIQKDKIDEGICEVFNKYKSIPQKLNEYIDEDKRKEKYIETLKSTYEEQLLSANNNIKNLINELNEQRNNLNTEINKQNNLNIELNKKLVDLTQNVIQKEDTIKYYQNMKLVKLTNAIRERKKKK